MSETYYSSEQYDKHRTLAMVAEAMDVVTTAIIRPPNRSASGRFETTLVLEPILDHAPPELITEIASCDLGVGRVEYQGDRLVVEVF